MPQDGMPVSYTHLDVYKRQVYIRHLFQTKQITAYFKPERDGYDVTIPFVACLFLGTIISWWWK